ncbi:MFS transporter [Streptomyces alanosinicus]|uniref:MFS transporter n=2 Tax=Streptomyces alanosinicus TaxID=68171 RepID=A0A918YQF5_9ACTN|nr:MFS transporter [Streptomyces alanosinicus]
MTFNSSDTCATTHEKPATPASGGVLLLVGIALTAANLRPATTSVAALLATARHALGASTTWVSLITAMPTLCFGTAAIAAPWMARRIGIHRAVWSGLTLLTLSLVGRLIDGAWSLFADVVLSCAAIAVCNVLIPVVVKQAFLTKVGQVAGIYSATMAAGGAAGSAASPWLQSAFGSWRLALAAWAVLSLGAWLVWASCGPALAVPRASNGPDTAGRRRSLFRSGLAWILTGYFAAQTVVAYVIMGWLPRMFSDAGMSTGQAGLILGAVLLLNIPMSLLLPPAAARSPSQSAWAVGLACASLAGSVGLLTAPVAGAWIWALLLSIGITSFPLALTLVPLRTVDPVDTARLSTMMQSTGYLLATVGPLLFGLLRQATGTWHLSLIALLVAVVLQTVLGAPAGRPRTV